MKTALIVFLLTLLTAFGQAPPYQRQFFDTNTDPVVRVIAGSNCWVTFGTTEPAGQVRTFIVDVPSSGGGTTNIILIATNDVFDTNIGVAIDGYTQGVYSVRIGQTNYFRMLVGGEAYGIKVYDNGNQVILSNLYPNIYWFTNPLGELHWSSNSPEVAVGSISNNYNVGIRGLLSLYGTNPSVPFIEFRTAGILYSNTFVGRLAGQSNATGVGNTFLGHAAGNKNITGNYNTFVGASAGAADIAGPHNTAVGNGALKKTTSNTGQNTVVGSQAMRDATTAQNNIAIGFESLWASINSSDNVIVGTSATAQQGPLGHNVAVGNSVGVGWTNASYNTAIGDFAMYVAALSAPSSNTAVGHEAGQGLTGFRNTAIGSEALRDASVAFYNTALGFFSGNGQIQGSNNMFLGDFVGVLDGNTMNVNSNIIIGVGGKRKAWYDGLLDWKFEPNLGTPLSIYSSNGIAIGYPTMTPHTNYAKTNTFESLRIPATNITFRFLVPTNIVTIVYSNTPGNPTDWKSNIVYGTYGDALINVPFYTASPSTNAPAWNEFVTRDYVDNHGGGGSTNFVYQNYGFATTNFVYNTTNDQWTAVVDFVYNGFGSNLTGVVFNTGGETNKAGLNSEAWGSSVAIGSGPLASDNSVAIGVSPIADANGIAIGQLAIGTNAGVAIGFNTRAGAGDYNVAIGHDAQINTAGFTRTTQIGPNVGNNKSNGFFHYMDWPYLDRMGLVNATNVVSTKAYISDFLTATNRAALSGSNVTVMSWDRFAQTNGQNYVVISNGNILIPRTATLSFGSYTYSLLQGDGAAKSLTLNPANDNAALLVVSNKYWIFGDWRALAGEANFKITTPTPTGNSFAVNTNQLMVTNGNVITSGSITATNGGLFGAAVTSTSTSTNDPAPTEFVVGGWVRGLFINGFVGYNSSNVMVNGTIGARFTTNYFDKFGGYGFVYSNSIPDSFTRVYSSVTTSQYLGAAVITNLTQIIGPVVVSSYIGFPSGGGRTLSVKPEIYYTYGTNGYGTNELFGDWDAGERVITAGTTNRYDWVIPVPYTVSTNGTFTVVRSFKVTAQTANPNVTIGGGTNWPSQISYSSAMSPVGQTIYASNILSGGAISSLVPLCGTYASNAPVTAYDISKPRQFYSTNDNITFNDLSGVTTAYEERESSLTLVNTKAGDITLTIPDKWRTPDGLRAFTVTNGQVAELSVKVWAGSATNAAVRMCR